MYNKPRDCHVITNVMLFFAKYCESIFKIVIIRLYYNQDYLKYL